MRIRWGPCGVGLDRHPWGVGDAGEPTSRPSPTNGNTNIYKYHQVPLEGKRYAKHSHVYAVA
uniref:Uncharacterized protein n=1 Tax=Ignisphaera aggregans TaxID=334771 RepID=A0A7J2U293_9CREN